MGMANVYIPPVKPRVGFYLQQLHGYVLWKIRHVNKKGIITAVRNPRCVLKVHRRDLAEHFIVRNDI